MAKRLERAKHLAKELCHGDGDGDIAALLEKWLSEMGVGWVLDLAEEPSAGTNSFLRAQPQRKNLAERWIRALTELTEYTHLDLRRLVLAEGRIVRRADVTPRFVNATVLKMLPFVDALLAAAADLDASTDTADVTNGGLLALLAVHDALSRASEGIQLCFGLHSSVQMEAHRRKLLNLLSEKEHRLEEAIWNTMEEVRTTGILSDGDDNEWGIQTSQGSPDICKVTWSLVTYIESLWGDSSRLNRIVRAAVERGRYIPNRNMTSSFLLRAEQDKASPLVTLASEMVSSLEVKLAERSKSFPDHGLRFLFLINNTHFIQQQLHPFLSKKYKDVLGVKIEDYIQKYLQASSVPVMLCLYNDTRRWFIQNSALPKFELEFRKTYTVHKLWKVPDPELRTRLRKAIVEQVIPGLTGYLMDNSVTSSGVTPQEREKMLLELFEG